MDGVPCIRGLRIPVTTIVGMVADGMTETEILKAYPDLEAAASKIGLYRSMPSNSRIHLRRSSVR